jgi:flagellar hook-associated protein 3 FlgL
MADISRVSSLATQNNAIMNFQDVRSSLVGLQDQISSGLKGRTFEDFNGQVEQLTGLEQQVGRAQRFQENNAQTVSRYRTIEDTLDQVNSIADELKSLYAARNNPAFANDIEFASQVRDLRRSIANELNTSFNGRFIFGGTKSNVPPIIDEPQIPESINPGTPDTAYYQGGTENIQSRVDDGIQKEFTVRADDPAIQELFASMSLALKAHSENDQDLLDQAQNLLDSGQDGIRGLTSKTRADRVDVERILDRQKDTELFISGLIEDIARVDQVEVSTKIANQEATLTATFQVFSRLSSLNLSDFL